MKKIIIAAVLMTTLISGPAMSDLTSELFGTREGICYNHPNKKLCLDGIKILMVSVKDAAQVNRECEAVEKLGGSNEGTRCDEVERLLKTLDE